MIEAILGIIIFLIAVFALVVVINHISFNSMVKSEIREMTENVKKDHSKIKSEKTDSLPAQLKNYLQNVTETGAEDVNLARLRQTGKFRTDQKQSWRDITAEQYIRTDEPAFIWRAKILLMPFLVLDARDKFNKNIANILIKVFSTFNLFNETHEEVYQSSILRYFSEMIWFPSAFIDNPYVTYKEKDEKTITAEISFNGYKCSADLHFDDENLITKITTDQRYMNRENEPWTAYYSNYRSTGKYKIPTHVEAEWHLSDISFKYAVLDIIEADYNIYKNYRDDK